MPKGFSIHIGLNHLDERHYGSRFSLEGCLGDVEAMHRLADGAGFESTVLQGEHATAEAVLGAVRGAAGQVGAGDLLLVTYSGHGARVRDVTGDDRDGYDETWCLYDRELVDDELYDCWADFPAGARILVVSDSCYSGDMIRDDDEEDDQPRIAEAPQMWGTRPLEETRQMLAALLAERGRNGAGVEAPPVMRGGGPLQRALSKRASDRVFARNHAIYTEVQERLPNPRRPVHADVLLLSAAQDNETAADGEKNGAFTRALLDIWNGGAFQGTYVDLHKELYARLRHRQHPQILALRPPAFARQRAFSI